MIKEDSRIMELPVASSPSVQQKISRKTNLKFFIIIAIIAIVTGLGGIIYSIVVSSSYHNKNPWAKAILLDDKITKMVNSQLSQPLLKADGLPEPNSLGSYVHFNVGEREGIDSYANLADIQIIQNIFATDDWIKNNLSIVETMLAGTGATLSGTHVIYQKQVLNLVLRPKILSYPYNELDDKYGLVTVNQVNPQQGIFTYQIRFALQLIATDFAEEYFDLKKTFDYTYDTTAGTSPFDLTLSQLLNLISNQKIINLVEKYNIQLDSGNEVVLNSLLKEYYPITRSDNRIQINKEIVNKDGLPFAPLNSAPSASDLALNIKYNSKKITSLQQFGAKLFDYHSANYGAVANIFTKIKTKMPIFINVKNSYDLYDRNSQMTFFPDAMNEQRVTSYRGFVKELGGESDNIVDNFDYSTNDNRQYVWGSEHQIFYNEVQIKFLNINNNLSDNIERIPTKIYYDQQSYSDTSINFQAFDLTANVKTVIDKIQYSDSEKTIDQRLTNQIKIIKASLKEYILKQLNNPYIKFDTIVKGISVGVASSTTTIAGTNFRKQAPINGNSRADVNKVYQDKLLSIPKIIITVQFSYDGTNNNLSNITYEYNIEPKIVKDISGVAKNDLNVLKNEVRLTHNYTTLDKITSLQNDYHQQIVNVANWWEHNNPMGAGTSSNNYPVENSNYNAFAVKINQINVGRNNNRNLRVGTYNVSIIATKESLNYQGEFSTGIINVTAAPIARISGGDLIVESSWTQQRAYRKIRANILEQAAFYGLNLTDRDFSITGILENNFEQLPIGNTLITIQALGNENVVTGTAKINLFVNAVNIRKYNDKINLEYQKNGNSIQKVINTIFRQLQDAVNNDGYNISKPQQYFNVIIYDNSNQQFDAKNIFFSTNEYWYQINITTSGSRYFSGQISDFLIVNKN